MDEAASQVDQVVDQDTQRDPEQIREEIEQTRREVGDAAAALAQKAHVKAQAKEKFEEIKVRVEGKREEVLGRVGEATPDSASQAASTVGMKVRESPVELLVAGAAVGGFLLGRFIARR